MKRRDLKIMWNSNGHWTNSGYAVETQYILKRMLADGWPLAEIAFYGLDSYPATIDGIKVYPKMADQWGSDAMQYHGNSWGADVIFSMQDVWTLNPGNLQGIKRWIPWVPIDKDPVPPSVLDKLRYAYKIVTFSKFGQDMLAKHGFTSDLILEGTDTDIYKPMDQAEMRKQFGIPQDWFLFGVVGANKEAPPRKGYQEMLEAFAKFYKNHPEAGLFFHTQQISPGNFPIADYARYLGFAHRVLFIDQYRASFNSAPPDIAKEINMFDVCLHSSQTEGFGLVIVEAQSCGVPVIINRCTSMPELVVEGKTGWISEIGQPRWTPDNSFVFPADVNSLHDQMEKVYKALKGKNTIKEDCRNHVLKNFDVNVIFNEKWVPFLESLQEEILPQPK